MPDRSPPNAPHDAPVGDNRPSVYPEAGKWIYRASSFGSCDKELTAIRCGFTPAPFPDRFKKIFADGHRGEDVIVAELESRGYVITDRQAEINWNIPGTDCVIRGHIDGIIVTPEGARSIFDAKTTSARYGISRDLHKKYELQLSIYGHALDLTSAALGVGEKDPETGDVVPSSITMQEWSSLPVSKGAIIARMHKLDGFAKHYEETGDYPFCDEKQYPCGAFQLHHNRTAHGDDADPYGGFFKPVLEDDSLDRYAAMYVEAQQLEAKAKDDKANARKLIVAHVGGENPTATESHNIKFTGTGIKKVLLKDELARYLSSLGPGAPKLDDFYGTEGASKSIKVETIGANE